MRTKSFTLTIQSDADGICASQTPSAGGEQTLSLDGALVSNSVATLNHSHLITITSVGDDSGRTFTITGTDYRGTTVTEDVTGANAGTAKSTKFFKTVTEIKVDDNTAGAVTAGVNGESVSNLYLFCNKTNPFNVGMGFDVTGTIHYTVQHTFDDVQVSDLSTLKFFDHDDLANKNKDEDGNYAFAFIAARVLIVSGNDGASIKGRLIQSGI